MKEIKNTVFKEEGKNKILCCVLEKRIKSPENAHTV